MPEISKAYEPATVETRWYQFWLDHRLFVADAASSKPGYSIVIPPPNVTGVLHMGHVLNNTIQDVLARKARMDGKEVLWLPGTDHAGIATEGMVAKQLRKEEKKSKQDIGREEFIKRVWAWKEKHGGIIIAQLKKLGCSCDWSRERFTMDPEYARDVQRVFVDLYKKGLIYRGKRMVNWCPATQTALSDEEVEMKPQKGFMYHFKVEVMEAPGTWLTIATTRPETIPGDTAVAVNPKDPRYAHLIGKHIVRPLPHELPREKKLIPIIGDEHVDFEFGTGVLKVTPAHDKADFEIGQRHKLPVVDIMNPNGTMNELAGQSLDGLDRFEARKVAVEKLKEIGAFVEEKPYENNVGFSQRADVPIEPRLSEQWFLKYPSVEQSKASVQQDDDAVGRASSRAADAQDGSSVASPHHRMHFHPQRWAKVYDHWLTNIQDWCISRQLWWGHRVPVWTRICDKDDLWLFIETEADFIRFESPSVETKSTIKFLNKDGTEIDGWHGHQDQGPFTILIIGALDSKREEFLRERGWQQDPDVLDTWFSSWLWPFATMGWTGDKSEDANNPTLQKFYPTTDLVTGPDIIFFWVARMIMAGYEYMGEMPFKNVYFTGIIRDKQGRKMSKSLGNSPDPLELIRKYGADALRFGTLRSAPLGQDILFDEKDVELGRNFCNKLWNACRFRQMQGGEVQGEINPAHLSGDDKWILMKLDAAISELTQSLAEYKFSEAAATIYRFFWGEYCDWYVEASKAVLGKSVEMRETPPHPGPLPPEGRGGEGDANRANTLAVIDFVLSHTLRLFHPFMPFITEELWHGMGYHEDMPPDQGGQSIMFAAWPKAFDAEFKDYFGLDEASLAFTTKKYDLVTQGRHLRREGNIQSGKKVKFVLKPAAEISASDVAVLKILLNAEALEVDAQHAPKKGTLAVHSELGELYLPVEGLVDFAAEKARLRKELEKIDAEILKVRQKLANPAFTQKVPPEVLQEHEKRLADWLAKKQHVQAALDALEG
jgi:valyl-tRNA synthetase